MIRQFAILDSEASGLFRKDLPRDDDSQPHLLQLSCKVVDSERRRVSRFTRVIRPEGWSIEAEAMAVHGISEERAHQIGSPLEIALIELQHSIANASLIIGFNLFNYDGPLIDLSLKRVGGEGAWWRKRRPDYRDCMEIATPVLNLPGQFGEPKFPTLEEAFNFFAPDFREVDEPAPEPWRSNHDAEDDVSATEEVFFNLLSMGAIR